MHTAVGRRPRVLTKRWAAVSAGLLERPRNRAAGLCSRRGDEEAARLLCSSLGSHTLLPRSIQWEGVTAHVRGEEN